MEIRSATPETWGFILSSFISSFRQASTHSEDLTGKQIASLLTSLVSNGWQCLVAEFESVIGAWIVFDKNQRLAWVFVRSMFRRQGLAKLMISRAGIDMNKPIVSPFVNNRDKGKCPLRLNIRQRPFLTLPNAETVVVN